MLKPMKITLAIIGAVIVLLLLDLTPFGGNITFYSKWIECGQKPVELRSKPGLAWYVQSSSFEPFRLGYTNYICTPLQAEQAGYSANPNSYEFPNLKNT